MSRVSCVAAAAAALLAFPAAAQSQSPGPACVKRTDLIKHLESKYHEAPAAVGLADNGSLLEVFASKSGETWTVTVTMPNGISCMVATGQQWQDLPRVVQIDDPV
jgi:hypothetical protein